MGVRHSGIHQKLLTWIVAVGATAAAISASVSTAHAEEVVNISGYLGELRVISDGKGHYIAVHPNGPADRFYYGDDKTLYAQQATHRFQEQGKSKDSRGFWAPWVKAGRVGGKISSLEIETGKSYRVHCGDKTIEYSDVGAEERQRILSEATFRPRKWKRIPLALARDEDGNYYLIDKYRDPYRKGYRMFVGRRGRMSERAITDVVADSGGFIFATKKGDLSIVTLGDTPTVSWTRGKGKTKLTYVPVERNVRLIYYHLDVYRGDLGTPCDYL